MLKRKSALCLALVLVFLLAMSSLSFAANEIGETISNELTGEIKVSSSSTVSDLDGLKTALADKDITTIILEDNITIKTAIDIFRPVTINGMGKTITFEGDQQGWQGNYIFKAHKTKEVVFENINFKGGDAAILVNGSEVTLKDSIKINGMEFGGIEVSQGVNVTEEPKLNVEGTISFVSPESGILPVIWIDGKDSNDNWVIVQQGLFEEVSTQQAPNGKPQYYFFDKEEYNNFIRIANVETLGELRAALANEKVEIINIMDDISDIGERLEVNRPITINGKENSLKFAYLGNKPYGERHGILIASDNVTINDLKVEMANEEEWQGLYGVQVYNSKNVTINNYTGSGADAALFVNSSDVKLTGNINVGGNEFGGIEVCKGTGLDHSPSLDVTDAVLENADEAPGKPTIWIDKLEGKVEGFENEPYKFTKHDGNKQYHYYLNLKNAELIKLSWDVAQDEYTSPFIVTVSAEKKIDDPIVNVLYIVEIEDGKDNITAVEIENGEHKEQLGYDAEGGFWYWGDRAKGFTFVESAETTFKVTAKPGTYKVKIYAVQLDK
ncbi:MAG: hypothetical protein GX187_05010 [Clostridiaceae bacterium]|nr:hypothetical protein [Clostridiaceae bacterium]